MSWVFVDDHASEDEQFCAAGGLASWYHVCAHSYCRRKEHLRQPAGEALDFVPDTNAQGLYARYTPAQARACIKELLRVGLWEQVEGGYVLTDYMRRYHEKAGSITPSAGAPDYTPPEHPSPRQTRNQLGGLTRASQAQRGPAGRFQPRQPTTSQTPPASTSLGDQPNQLRASDPSPVPVPIHTEKAAAKDQPASARDASLDQPKPAAAASVSSDICEKAKEVLEHPNEGWRLKPERWPELQHVAALIHQHANLPAPRLGTYATDGDVRALVAVLAQGWRPDELERLAPPLGEWLKAATPDGRPRTLAMLSPGVLRIAQGQAQQVVDVEQQARDLVKATVRALPLAPAVGARS